MSDTHIHATIADLKPDPKNARRRTQRSSAMIVNSLHEVGAARSIVIDEDNRILAGNGTVEAAAEAGIENVRIVEVDGETLVAVRRTGLTEEQKIRLALYDNRTAELAEWDPPTLAELDSVDIEGLWGDEEFAALIGGASEPVPPDAFGEVGEDLETAYCCPKCGYHWSGKPK